MFTERDVRRIVGRVYAAAYDQSLWQACFDDLAAFMGATTAGFVCASPQSSRTAVSLFTNLEEAAFEDYVYFSDKNVFVQRAERIAPGQIFTDRIVPREELRRTEYYNDYLRRYDIATGMGACLLRGDVDAFVSFNRPEGQGDWSSDAERLLAVVVPHLQRAVLLHAELSSASHDRMALGEVLNQLNVAIIIVDRDHKVVFANTPALHLLTRHDGLTDREGRLTATHRDDAKTLFSLIQATLAVTAKPWVPVPRTLNIRSNRTGTFLRVVAGPALFTNDLGAGDTMAVLFVIEPRPVLREATAMLRTLYGLTPAESRIAAAIGHGVSVNNLASMTGRSPETIRKQLKRVFAKTNTRRQQELTALVAALPSGT